MKNSTLIKKFHSACAVNGISPDEKEAIKASYGVESSTELSESQLNEIINKLENEADMWRKRTMAAIGAFLRLINKTDNAQIIKSIACRASGYDDFNDIPVSKLRSIYYEFVKKNKVTNSARNIKLTLEYDLAFKN